jgi:hypothetical protein
MLMRSVLLPSRWLLLQADYARKNRTGQVATTESHEKRVAVAPGPKYINWIGSRVPFPMLVIAHIMTVTRPRVDVRGGGHFPLRPFVDGASFVR